MTTPFFLAMAQMAVQPGEPEQNLTRAEALIAQAADAGCRVVVLPECLDLGWLDRTIPRLAESIPGPRVARLANAAQRHGVYVAAGLNERHGDCFYNAAVLLGPDGGLLLHHRKINELRFGAPHDIYSIGDRLGVVETELGCLGLNICADNFASAIGEVQARMGAQMILSPCAWAVPPEFDNTATPYGQEWLNAYIPLCRRFQITMVGVSYVGPVSSGPWAGWRCIGTSLAIGPDGEVIATGAHGIDAEELRIIPITLIPRTASGTDIDRTV